MARSFELLLVSALSALVGNALEGKALVAGLVFVATSFSKKRDLVLVAASHLVAGACNIGLVASPIARAPLVIPALLAFHHVLELPDWALLSLFAACPVPAYAMLLAAGCGQHSCSWFQLGRMLLSLLLGPLLLWAIRHSPPVVAAAQLHISKAPWPTVVRRAASVLLWEDSGLRQMVWHATAFIGVAVIASTQLQYLLATWLGGSAPLAVSLAGWWPLVGLILAYSLGRMTAGDGQEHGEAPASPSIAQRLARTQAILYELLPARFADALMADAEVEERLRNDRQDELEGMGPSITGVMGSMAGSYDESSYPSTGLHNTPHAAAVPHVNWAPVNEDLLMAMTAVRVARKSLSVEAVRRVSMSLDHQGGLGAGRNSGYGLSVRRRSAVWDTVGDGRTSATSPCITPIRASGSNDLSHLLLEASDSEEMTGGSLSSAGRSLPVPGRLGMRASLLSGLYRETSGNLSISPTAAALLESGSPLSNSSNANPLSAASRQVLISNNSSGTGATVGSSGTPPAGGASVGQGGGSASQHLGFMQGGLLHSSARERDAVSWSLGLQQVLEERETSDSAMDSNAMDSGSWAQPVGHIVGRGPSLSSPGRPARLSVSSERFSLSRDSGEVLGGMPGGPLTRNWSHASSATLALTAADLASGGVPNSPFLSRGSSARSQGHASNQGPLLGAPRDSLSGPPSEVVEGASGSASQTVHQPQATPPRSRRGGGLSSLSFWGSHRSNTTHRAVSPPPTQAATASSAEQDGSCPKGAAPGANSVMGAGSKDVSSHPPVTLSRSHSTASDDSEAEQPQLGKASDGCDTTPITPVRELIHHWSSLSEKTISDLPSRPSEAPSTYTADAALPPADNSDGNVSIGVPVSRTTSMGAPSSLRLSTPPQVSRAALPMNSSSLPNSAESPVLQWLPMADSRGPEGGSNSPDAQRPQQQQQQPPTQRGLLSSFDNAQGGGGLPEHGVRQHSTRQGPTPEEQVPESGSPKAASGSPPQPQQLLQLGRTTPAASSGGSSEDSHDRSLIDPTFLELSQSGLLLEFQKQKEAARRAAAAAAAGAGAAAASGAVAWDASSTGASASSVLAGPLGSPVPASGTHTTHLYGTALGYPSHRSSTPVLAAVTEEPSSLMSTTCVTAVPSPPLTGTATTTGPPPSSQTADGDGVSSFQPPQQPSKSSQHQAIIALLTRSPNSHSSVEGPDLGGDHGSHAHDSHHTSLFPNSAQLSPQASVRRHGSSPGGGHVQRFAALLFERSRSLLSRSRRFISGATMNDPDEHEGDDGDAAEGDQVAAPQQDHKVSRSSLSSTATNGTSMVSTPIGSRILRKHSSANDREAGSSSSMETAVTGSTIPKALSAVHSQLARDALAASSAPQLECGVSPFASARSSYQLDPLAEHYGAAGRPHLRHPPQRLSLALPARAVPPGPRPSLLKRTSAEEHGGGALSPTRAGPLTTAATSNGSSSLSPQSTQPPQHQQSSSTLSGVAASAVNSLLAVVRTTSAHMRSPSMDMDALTNGHWAMGGSGRLAGSHNPSPVPSRSPTPGLPGTTSGANGGGAHENGAVPSRVPSTLLLAPPASSSSQIQLAGPSCAYVPPSAHKAIQGAPSGTTTPRSSSFLFPRHSICVPPSQLPAAGAQSVTGPSGPLTLRVPSGWLDTGAAAPPAHRLGGSLSTVPSELSGAGGTGAPPTRGILAEYRDSISFLFTDICGFTAAASEVSAADVVLLLDRVFSEYDRLLQLPRFKQAGVEKVDVIGDCAFFAADGPGHAAALLELAVALSEVASQVAMPGSGAPVMLRSGLHTGGAVCGVLGRTRKKYSYFGNSVNLASRMESTGTPGMIQMTCDFAEAVNQAWGSTGGGPPPGWHLRERGEVYVKGAGNMRTWVLARVSSTDSVVTPCPPVTPMAAQEATPHGSPGHSMHPFGSAAASEEDHHRGGQLLPGTSSFPRKSAGGGYGGFTSRASFGRASSFTSRFGPALPTVMVPATSTATAAPGATGNKSGPSSSTTVVGAAAVPSRSPSGGGYHSSAVEEAGPGGNTDSGRGSGEGGGNGGDSTETPPAHGRASDLPNQTSSKSSKPGQVAGSSPGSGSTTTSSNGSASSIATAPSSASAPGGQGTPIEDGTDQPSASGGKAAATAGGEASDRVTPSKPWQRPAEKHAVVTHDTAE